MRRLALSLLVLALCSARAEGQTDSVLTRVFTDTLRLLGRQSPDSAHAVASPVEVRMIRLGSAFGGFVFGMLLGGFAGHEIQAEACGRDCKTLTGDALLTGGAIGGALGAALGAAFLDLKSICTFDRRLLRTLAGAAVGGSALFAASGGLEKRRGRSAFFIPIGAVGGSLGSLTQCWKSQSWQSSSVLNHTLETPYITLPAR